jgi:hypothetical protein
LETNDNAPLAMQGITPDFDVVSGKQVAANGKASEFVTFRKTSDTLEVDSLDKEDVNLLVSANSHTVMPNLT